MNEEIVWYPGHMAKAKREIAALLSQADAVIEVLDARLPISSQNPDFKKLFSSKPILTVLNKTSLADEKKEQKFINYLQSTGRTVIAADCKTGRNISKIIPAIKELLAERAARDRAKGVNSRFCVLTAGITNVGKSTLINTCTKTKKAKAEDRPGVTRETKRIASAGGVDFLDTPGLLWHKFDDRRVGVKLACTGAIKDEILDLVGLCRELLTILISDYPQNLADRYKISVSGSESALEMFEKIGRKRGFLISGGEIDEDRTAAVILDEFRGGKIGRITLDRI